MRPFPHQTEGVAWLLAALLTHRSAGLFDDPGLGKTGTAILTARARGDHKVLVLAPTAVRDNWLAEIRMWHPGATAAAVRSGTDRLPDTRYVVMTHGLLRSPAIRAQIHAQRWGLALVDEAHTFRNPRARFTRCLVGAPGEVWHERFASVLKAVDDVVWITGTPMVNNPGDLWTAFATCPDPFLRQGDTLMRWATFRRRYCVMAPTAYGDGWKVVGAQNEAELGARLRAFGLRRKKSDHLNLPAVMWAHATLTCDKVPAELREFERMLAARGVVLDEGLNLDKLLTVLREHDALARFRRACGVAKIAPTVELAREMLDGGCEALVIGAHHREVFDGLAQGLERYGVVRFTGDVPAAQRTEGVGCFQAGKARVALCQHQAGGVGITLTRACDVLMCESSWVPGENVQLVDRCHRIGQAKPVTARVLGLAGSVDDLVSTVLLRKTQMIAAVETA